MLKRISLGLVGLMTLLGAEARASTCTHEIPDLDKSGDRWYYQQWNCSSGIYLPLWQNYHYNEDYWDEGYGFENCCDITLPLGRTLNSQFALHFSDPNPALNPNDLEGSLLRMGGNYAVHHIDELLAGCEHPTADAVCHNCQSAVLDEWVMLYMGFFYHRSVIERAGILLHEARHDEGPDHWPDNLCARQGSCDWSYESWGSDGVEAEWLRQFFYNGKRGNIRVRKQAFDRHNSIVTTAFIADESWRAIPESDLSPIWFKYQDLGGYHGLLGFPTTDETVCQDGIGHYTTFQNGQIFWHPSLGAYEVHGAIGQHWGELSWERGVLGYPISDELVAADNYGRFNVFQNGSLYWSPESGAHEVHGLIRSKWATLKWVNGFLGYPVTDELTSPDGQGKYNHFQGGSIYYSPWTGAWEVHGDIRAKWFSMGGEAFGYPATDETTCADGQGKYNHFQYDRSIYWTPWTGAWSIIGAIRQKFLAMGAEAVAGYPISDEEAAGNGGRVGRFEHCNIYYTDATGAYPVCRKMLDSWRTHGAETGTYGYPTGDAYKVDSYTYQPFQRGTLTVYDP